MTTLQPGPRRSSRWKGGAEDTKDELVEAFQRLDDAMRRVMAAWRNRDRMPVVEALPAPPEVLAAEERFEHAKLEFFEVASKRHAGHGQDHEEQRSG